MPLDKISIVAITQSAKLKRFLRRYEKNESDIEDIIGQALLESVKSIQSFKGTSSIETWFFSVCRNLATQHIAKKTRESEYFEDIKDFDEYYLVADERSDSPDTALEKKEAVSRASDLISKLPNELQTIFFRIYLDGLPYADVAQELEIPIGTLKSRINRLKNLITLDF